jgi:putative transposase
MKYDPLIHHRKSIRLKGYDYSQEGVYFITICVQDSACLFGEITDGEMVLNDTGKMVEIEWLALKKRFPNIELHEYVVMPNHFHGILEIAVGATLVVAQNMTVAQKNVAIQMEFGNGRSKDLGRPQGHAHTGKTVGDMLDAFKSITTVEYIHGVKQLGWVPFNGKLWQRDYYEHIIRDDRSYQTISEYILSNPAKWAYDQFYKL